MILTTSTSPPDTVSGLRATLKYSVPSDEKPIYVASIGGEEARLDLDGEFQEREVEISDGRARMAAAGNDVFHIDREGFSLVSHESAIVDFYDLVAIESTYEIEIMKLVAAATGAKRTAVFDHTWRADSVEQRAARQIREPSAVIHNDYTNWSGPQRVRDISPAEADDLLNRRFSIVNVWRAIGHPAETSMLALCDARSATDDDLIRSERRAKDRIGEILMASYNPAHKWIYFPAMSPDEALLLKTYDSSRDGPARFAIHTAFDHPAPPAGAMPRESMESRVFAFF